MADWNTSGATSRTRNGGPGRRKHWKLPDMIQGVRHRFRDKRRSKSPDFCLDTDTTSAASYTGLPRTGASLPRAASMLSTDYGFGADTGPTSLTRAVHNGGQSNKFRTNNTWDTSNGGQRVPPITVTRLQSSSSIDPGALSEADLISSSAVSSRLTSSSSSARTQPPSALTSVGRAQSVSAVNQTGLSHNGSNGNSIQRGKSVRFGENRISVFLQDSTQALEECVRLALSYAEETKRGDYCSDTEAVTLSRSLHHDPGLHQTASDQRPGGQFWSDSEDRHQPRERGRHDKTCAKNQARTLVTSGECGADMRGPPTPTNYKPKSLGQAVNSLDRVERLDKSHLQKSRQKRSAQINEIFSFIDKILSGCDSGCNDEFCPLVREAARTGEPQEAAGSWTKQNKTYRFNSSSVSSEYQSKKSSSFPRGYGSDSYAYTQSRYQRGGQSSTNGLGSATPSEEAGAGGWASDSDCDSSECSTLVRAGHQPPRRPPRSRLRTAVHRGRQGDERTTEDVFAQIIVCCETNKESLGMPKYLHLHQKISQTVCNAIFLCKVIQYCKFKERLKYLESGDKMQYLVQINFMSALRLTGYIREKL